MRHKVVLYNPKAVFYTMPLALLAVGSALRRDDYDVRIIDARLEADPMKALLAEVDDALCVGMSVLTGDPIRDALATSAALKARRPDLPVIWGGWHPSLFPAETLAASSVDVTVQGQGEVTFAELVERLADRQPLDGLLGTAFRRGQDVVTNPPRPLTDMNELPRYRYDLLPVADYYRLKKKPQLDYISSVGCFFRCAFCADPFVYKRRWVAFEPRRVAEELEELWRRYHFRELAFQDETFFTYPRRVVAIAEELLRRRLPLSWTGTLRADQGVRLSEEEFALAVRSGMSQVMVGVESASQEMMDWMLKDAKVEQVLETAERCRRHGVGVIFNFIVGFPGESDDSVEATLKLMARLRAMSPRFETPLFYFKPYPGSRITQDLVRAGYSLPQTLEEWADFDFVGSSGPWITNQKRTRVERFKFYNRFAGGPETWRRWPLQKLSRWRLRRDFFRLPWEKFLVERLRPSPKLS